VRRTPLRYLALVAVSGLALTNAVGVFSTDELHEHDHKQEVRTPSLLIPAETVRDAACVDGFADEFPCESIDLLSFTPITESRLVDGVDRYTTVEYSDVWGWTSDSGEDYVIAGATDGVKFFRVTDRSNPVYLGDLPNTGAPRIWHDIKIVNDHAFIVSESQAHGMQVFDLTQLDAATGPLLWPPNTNYLPQTTSAHNIAANDDTDRVYIVGGGTSQGSGSCGSALHIVDATDPTTPAYAGCYSGDGYVHDTQCIVYDGPDADHQGKEICVNSSETEVSIVDVTDPANIEVINKVAYERPQYTHQGWFTEDRRFFLLGDELDENGNGDNDRTRTIIFDMSDLDAIAPGVDYWHDNTSIDHNLYTLNGLVYQSNYTSGLRVLSSAGLYDPETPMSEGLEPIGFFDVYPDNDNPTFDGTWSNYPYFGDGVVAVTSYDGLFLVKVHDDVLAEHEFDPRAL
jgi:choice-of-anchor B domain-containing protein